MNPMLKMGVGLAIVAFLLINPITRSIIRYLVLPTGLDDLIFWPIVFVTIIFLSGGSVWALIAKGRGRMTQIARRFLPVLVLAILVSSTTGCYWFAVVGEDEVGLHMGDGASVDRVMVPGRYTDMGFYSDLKIVDVGARTMTWSDPDLVTKDKQPIGLALGLTYSRERGGVEEMWQDYNLQSTDDEALEALIENRIPRVAKEVTAKFTLDEMLGIAPGIEISTAGREVVSREVFIRLERELEEFGVILRDVGVNNIIPDPGYLEQLKKKARAQVDVEVAREETKKLDEQLNQEKAQTAIEIERARRENEINAELAKTFETSPEYFQLEQLRLMGNIFGDQDKVWFIPQGTDLTLFLNQTGSQSIVPAAAAAQ
jgi:regulator of protease activity HflC (stomatin/prohibitin superfamily)